MAIVSFYIKRFIILKDIKCSFRIYESSFRKILKSARNGHNLKSLYCRLNTLNIEFIAIFETQFLKSMNL